MVPSKQYLPGSHNLPLVPSFGFGLVDPPRQMNPSKQFLFARSERVIPISSQYFPIGQGRQPEASTFISVSEYVPIGQGIGERVPYGQ